MLQPVKGQNKSVKIQDTTSKELGHNQLRYRIQPVKGQDKQVKIQDTTSIGPG